MDLLFPLQWQQEQGDTARALILWAYRETAIDLYVNSGSPYQEILTTYFFLPTPMPFYQ